MNLRTLGSDKSEFRTWNSKLINAIASELGMPWRTFMSNLNRALDRDRKVLSNSELDEIEGAADCVGNGQTGKQFNEVLYSVLVDKTEGEAAQRVLSEDPGQGMAAYQRIYIWFAGTTSPALSERMTHLTRPTIPSASMK